MFLLVKEQKEKIIYFIWDALFPIAILTYLFNIDKYSIILLLMFFYSLLFNLIRNKRIIIVAIFVSFLNIFLQIYPLYSDVVFILIGILFYQRCINFNYIKNKNLELLPSKQKNIAERYNFIYLSSILILTLLTMIFCMLFHKDFSWLNTFI